MILCGVESHICVMQTALDLLERDYQVHIVCDAVSSQRPHDRAVALERLKSFGAIMGTTETLLFDLMATSEHPNFKEISGLIKTYKETYPDEFRDDNSL